jgi:hypothetical protein
LKIFTHFLLSTAELLHKTFAISDATHWQYSTIYRLSGWYDQSSSPFDHHQHISHQLKMIQILLIFKNLMPCIPYRHAVLLLYFEILQSGKGHPNYILYIMSNNQLTYNPILCLHVSC